LLGRAARVFADEEITSEERLRWSVPAVMAASMVWDDERWPAIEARHVRSCREAGLLAQLALSVNGMAIITVWRGDFAAAASLVAEAEAIAARPGPGSPATGPCCSPDTGSAGRARPADRGRGNGCPNAGQGGGIQWS